MRKIIYMKYQNLIYGSLFLFGCSQLPLEVVSHPEGASVYLQKEKENIKLGNTPLKIDPNSLEDANNIVITMPNYSKQIIFYEKRLIPNKTKIAVKLEETKKENSNDDAISSSEKMKNVIRKVSFIQSLLLRKQYAKAEILSTELVNEYPKLSVGWNLLGNVYYLQSQNKLALDNYRKANLLDPENPETLEMLNLLDSRINKGSQ